MKQRKEANFIGAFVAKKRHEVGLTQIQFANLAGVSLSFLRDLEQGKQTLCLAKVQQVLSCFNCELFPREKSL
jgi:y4mF family transcriptional regulator